MNYIYAFLLGEILKFKKLHIKNWIDINGDYLASIQLNLLNLFTACS